MRFKYLTFAPSLFAAPPQSNSLVISKSEFDKKYTTCSLLGKGGFGTVYAGFRNRDRLPVAIKVINKNRVLHGKNDHIPIEVALMTMTSHIDGVIKLIEYFELPDCFMLILERMMSSNKDTTKSNIGKSIDNFIPKCPKFVGRSYQPEFQVEYICYCVGNAYLIRVLHNIHAF